MDSQQNKFAFITGCSSGIGLQLTLNLLSENFQVYGLGINDPKIRNSNFNFIELDLNSISQVSNFQFPLVKNSQIVFIHNSGVIGDIKQIGDQSQKSINQCFNINVVSPMILTNSILKQLDSVFNTFHFIFISSGAAQRPIVGWSTYGASKAAINQYALTLSEEFINQAISNAHVHSISPGVVDTNMQRTIRSSNAADFPEHLNFVAMYETNKLKSTELVSRQIIQIILKPDEYPDVIMRLENN